MSYLHTPRLTFSGDFEANVSTVNNDVRFYKNDTFIPQYQERIKSRIDDVTRGEWNPNGGSSFKMLNCKVTQVTYKNKRTCRNKNEDSIIGQSIGGASDQSAGKIVDIDPMYQLTSELWGVTLRVFTSNDDLIFQGKILNCSMRDLQQRIFNDNILLGPDGDPGAKYTSIITDVEWGKSENISRFTQEIRDTTENNCLCISLSVFGFSSDFTEPVRFTLGYLVGVIGPYFSSEPKTFALARRLVGYIKIQDDDDIIQFEQSDFLFNESNNSLTIDFGNSFPLFYPDGTTLDVGKIFLAVATVKGVTQLSTLANTLLKISDRLIIGEVNYQHRNWLGDTSGIITFELSHEATVLLKTHQLVLLRTGTVDYDVVIASEHESGICVRADQSVHRLDPDESAEISIYACKWGEPYKNASINLNLAASFGGYEQPGSPLPIEPYTGIPASAISFSNEVITDEHGIAQIRITGYDPGNPRAYIDGQLYFIRYTVSGLPDEFRNFLDVIVIHLRDKYVIPEKPTWNDIKPIFTQYANLYPIMSKHIVNLNSREDVLKNKKILLYSFTRDIENPHYMPITRDLSLTKIKTIVKWLELMIEDETNENYYSNVGLTKSIKSPLLPTLEDQSRPLVLVMQKSKFKKLTKGKFGKGAAIKKIRSAIHLVGH